MGILSNVSLPKTTDEQVVAFVDSLLPKFKAPTNATTWPAQADKIRRDALKKIYLRNWPDTLIRRKPKVAWADVLKPKGAPYVIRKLRYEILPDYWIPALLYQPKKLTGKVPVVLNANGHHDGGKATDYKQARCANLARRGMLAFNYEFAGMSELTKDRDHNRIAFLELAGLGGVGVHYLIMSKGLDVLLAQPNADKKRVAMTGLSGGGWQTIVFSALDTRITHSIPVAGYTTVRGRFFTPGEVGDLEQVPPDMATVLDFDTMTAMLAPRPTLSIMNNRDECCFRTDRAKPLVVDAVRPTFEAMGADFVFHNNLDPGTHNYDADNRSQLYKFLGRHFGMDFPAEDLHTDAEIYTERELMVGLPLNQSSMMRIASATARETAAKLRTPKTRAAKAALRKKVADLIRLPRYLGKAKRVGREDGADLYQFSVGPWTLPVAVDRKSSGKVVDLVFSTWGDLGEMHREMTDDRTVVSTDLLGFGCSAAEHQYLMLIDTAGRRILGEQVAQIIALARWAKKISGASKVRLVTGGFPQGFMALMAAAMQPGLFCELRAEVGYYMTLTGLFDRETDYIHHQSMFVPDLLTVADIEQLEALAEGVTISAPFRATKALRP